MGREEEVCIDESWIDETEITLTSCRCMVVPTVGLEPTTVDS